ncbi:MULTISPECIES: shikimate kinase [Clostridium]|uniref:shikimate kinase n=2 Tax=Clostridium TaxID=1485 RepID=UPI0012E4FA8F|nr:Shikimate kinase [Clostridium neonatale]CAI3203956.1 Shikimate kinase [Clostridium neonatale]CAI3536617.1 Shikimate kinase [Clostridium neonatale]CAI3638414.1 Shikimate kinase [Clostridium neonatale]CAI3697406.1 Shikimate kinase [Clostridium neonatale]
MGCSMGKNIVLIGMPGCGKTTLGKILNKELSMEFYDMDNYIERKTDKKISELFEKGENYFRDIESLACEELSKNKNVIISTGGGVIKRKENIDFLKENGIVIFIDRSVDDIIGDVDISKRPLLKEGKEKVLKLYEERYLLYKNYADEIVVNNKNIEDTKNKIIDIYNNL